MTNISPGELFVHECQKWHLKPILGDLYDDHVSCCEQYLFAISMEELNDSYGAL